MSRSPHTTAQHNAGRQQIGDKSGVERGVDVFGNYLKGYLDGFAAANTAGGTASVGPLSPAAGGAVAKVTPWSLPGISAPLYPESLPRISDNRLHQSAASPSSASSCFTQYSTQNHSLPWENYERLPAPDEFVNSSPYQSFLDPRNLPFNSWPVSPGSQSDGLALNELEISASCPDEAPEVLVHRPVTSRDQSGNFVETYSFPTAGRDVLVQSQDQIGGTNTLGNVNLNEQAVIPRPSALDALRASQYPDAPVDSPLSDSRTQVAPGGAIEIVFRVSGTTRSKFGETSRKSTALTRKLGACRACRKKKYRCEQAKEEFAPCGRCARTPVHLLHAPCCRVEITNIKLFRLGTNQLATLEHWMKSKEPGKGTLFLENGTTAIEGPRRVQLTHDVCTTTFRVTISRYQPRPGDKTEHTWTDSAGFKQKYELPSYYISNMNEAGQNMWQYIKKARTEFTRALLVNSNPIILKTFKEAERYFTASKSTLVACALMFWSATRMIERSWLITGDYRLGLPPMKQSIGPCRLNPHIEAVPVTPIMDTQLDEIAIKHVLVPLKSKFLGLLKKKMLEKKKENWYEIFLTTFITLHNSEMIIGHIKDYSRRYGILFVQRPNDEASLSHAYYHACKTVLAYFHFASGGAAPLSLDWLGPTLDTSIMSQQQIAFLRNIKDEVLSQDAKLQNLKNESMYETEMFWCHQLLCLDWKADMPYAGPFLACTEKDFLLS